jgi:hypothetical protein
MPRISPAPATSGRHRHPGFVQGDPDLCGEGDLVENGGHPASGGVAHAMHVRPAGVQEGGGQGPERLGVAADFGLEVEVTAGQQDGDPVVADGAGEQHLVAGADHSRRQGDPAVHDPDAAWPLRRAKAST